MRHLVYSKFSYYKIDPADLDNAPIEPYPFCEDSTFRIKTVINEPAAQIAFEDWFKDQEIEWSFFIDGIYFAIQGRAEITYYQPPNFEREERIIAEAPCVFLVPRGCRLRCKVLSDEPFRRLVVDFPNPGYAFTADRA